MKNSLPNSPFISVIIPNYNHARFLDQRITSVLNQTYSNFELIILDDKSPDNSVEIINRYRTHPKVSHIIINDNNSGSTFKQWHKGILLAKGELVWIAESDDFCEPNLLETLVSKMKENGNCGLAYVVSQMVDIEGKGIGKQPKTTKDKNVSGKDFIKKYMSIGNPVVNASSAIFKKDIAQYIDTDYIKYKACGDRLFWIKIAEMGDVAIVNQPLNYFRQHDNKVSQKKLFDGCAITEAKLTYGYLVRQGYLKMLRKYVVQGYYTNLIRSLDFNSDEIKENLYRVWNVSINSNKFAYFLAKILIAMRSHRIYL